MVQLGVNINFELIQSEVCTANGKGQFSMFLRGENLEFVAETFKIFSSSPLPNVAVKPAQQDPDRFEYYFGRTDAPLQNEDFNLELVAVYGLNIGGKTDTVALVKPIPSVSPCVNFQELHAFGKPQFKFLSSAGHEVTGIQQWVLDGDTYRVAASFEAHLQETATDLEVVALTPHGFLRNRIPKVDCRKK
ncbi:MAG: hypothetical protein EOP06_31940 [Proteobacteria bacterium]|nr:MAG: hypothetical protein EOP06_31940 [Pseudomonadota bacterium]